MKLFADDTSLITVVQNKNDLKSQLKNDLHKVSDWAHKWKMSFNQDLIERSTKSYFFKEVYK